MTTSTNGLPVPDLSDDNNPPADLLALGNAVDDFYGAAVANAAALPASGDFPGQRKFLTDTTEVAVWNGTIWTGYTKTYTPTWTNVTLGTGGTLVNTASYVQVGKWVTVAFTLTLGTGGAFTGVVSMSLPVVSVGGLRGQGAVVFDDTSAGATARRAGVIIQNGSTAQFLLGDNAAGSQLVTTGVPFSWAVGDTLSGTYTFPVA